MRLLTIKILSVNILLLLSSIVIGQKRNYLSLGIKDNGICFGNSTQYNGLRFNLWDKELNDSIYNNINGINLGASLKFKTTNGISINLVESESSKINGVAIGGLGFYTNKINGLGISGIVTRFETLNGLGFAGLSVKGDTLNGIAISLFGNGTIDHSSEMHVINGLSISGFFNVINKINGITICIVKNETKIQNGLGISIFNKTDELHGIQFGIINYAGNNKKPFRWIPLFNFNFRKKASR